MTESIDQLRYFGHVQSFAGVTDGSLLVKGFFAVVLCTNRQTLVV